MNTYLLNNLLPARAFQSPDDSSEVFTLDSMGGFRVMITNDKDYLPTRISLQAQPARSERERSDGLFHDSRGHSHGGPGRAQRRV